MNPTYELRGCRYTQPELLVALGLDWSCPTAHALAGMRAGESLSLGAVVVRRLS